jgi:transketolase
MGHDDLDTLCINTLRTLSIDAIQRANSGHPGLPLGAAPMAHILWQRHLRVCGSQPDWPDRDRFVLSAGHGSMLLYSLLHVHGFALSMEDIKKFRQWKSLTPGHPEYFLTPGVDATTGPLGQGCANSVGMAIAERHLAHLFNRPNFTIVDHYTYGLLGDGDMMEGINQESVSLAGHLQLGKLIHLYDANDICLDGPTDMTFSEDVGTRYEASGWHVQWVKDGDRDLDGIDAAIKAAQAKNEKPSLIIVKTTIGFGSPNKAGSSSAHGSPLGADEIEETKRSLGWTHEPFSVPDAARSHFQKVEVRNLEKYQIWSKLLVAYGDEYPDLARLWSQASERILPSDWDTTLPSFAEDKSIATRVASSKVLNAIAEKVPFFMGGDADLSCSTKTAIGDGGSFEGKSGSGRNIHYGVREHAMGAIANGIIYHGGLKTYTATFFCFSDYMRPAIRLAALNGLPVTFIFTHDSIGLGEDGPTHQSVEHLMALRCMPNLVVVRPGDAHETVQAWRYAMQETTRPVALVLSRQNLPVLPATAKASGLNRGAYILSESNTPPAAIVMASGSELSIALEAQRVLAEKEISARVVSFPSWELFSEQDLVYQQKVLPPEITCRVAIEAGVTLGWEKWVGLKGRTIGVDRYGASAPGDELYQHYGLHAQAIVDAVETLL